MNLTLQQANAIYALNPSIVVIRGDVAYDKDGNELAYDKSQAEAKLAEMQETEESAQKAQETAKASALVKLSALGLTQDEINALL